MSGVHSHTHTHTESGASVTVSFKRFSNACNNCDHVATSFFLPEKGKPKNTQHHCDWRYGFHCFVNEANSFCVIAVCQFVSLDPCLSVYALSVMVIKRNSFSCHLYE